MIQRVSLLSILIVMLNLIVPITIPAEQYSIQEIMQQMTPKEKIRQLVMPDTHDNSQRLPDEKTEQLINEYFAGSLIIYGYYGATLKNRLFKSLLTSNIEPWIAPIAARKLSTDTISEEEKQLLLKELKIRL